MTRFEKKLSAAKHQVRLSGQFVNDIELLFMAKRLANRASELASSGSNETESRQDFACQYNSLSEKLQCYRRFARTQIPNKTLNELQ